MRSFIIILICIASTGVVLYLAGLWVLRNRLLYEKPQSGVWSFMPIGMTMISFSAFSLAEAVHIIPRSAGYINEWYVALFGITLLGLMCIFWVLQVIWINQGNKRRNSQRN